MELLSVCLEEKKNLMKINRIFSNLFHKIIEYLYHFSIFAGILILIIDVGYVIEKTSDIDPDGLLIANVFCLTVITVRTILVRINK